MKRKTNINVLILSICLALIFVVVGANIFVVSVFGYHLNSGTDITEEIHGIHTVRKELHGERGKILDRNGHVLAEDVVRYTMYANIDPERMNADGTPASVQDKEGAATIISEVIGDSYESVLGYLNSDAKQVEFGYRGKYLTPEQKLKLESSDILGLGFSEIRMRHYPNREYDSKLIGNTIYDEVTKQIDGTDGLGIERFYNEELQGENGFEQYQQDGTGFKLVTTDNIREEPRNGQHIQLTLDRDIQYQLEESLKGMTTDPDVMADAAWGIVLDAKTGEVLGWGEYPGFDPDNENNTYSDRVSDWLYEPGSTMKTFAVASAIEDGVWSDTELFDSGPFHVGDGEDGAVRLESSSGAIHTITNANYVNYGVIPYDYGYAMSSNVMIAELMSKKLDYKSYTNYLNKLRFFTPLDMDRIVGPAGNDGSADISVLAPITHGFGQGITVTMAQMAQAYTSVMSDGSVLKPYVIDAIVDPVTGEATYQGQPQNLGRAYSPETASHMRDLMKIVVDSGSAQRFINDKISVIGKTGTAQMVVEGETGYSDSQFIFSSVLGFPYEDPKVIVYTAYSADYGHSISASSKHVNEIVETSITAMELLEGKGDEVITEVKALQLPNVINETASMAKETIAKRGFVPIVIGNGNQVIQQFPVGGSQLITNERVFLYTGGDSITMPNMTGWSHKEVINFWGMTGISVEVSGSGFVYEQEIPEGTVLEEDTIIRVKLQ